LWEGCEGLTSDEVGDGGEDGDDAYDDDEEVCEEAGHCCGGLWDVVVFSIERMDYLLILDGAMSWWSW